MMMGNPAHLGGLLLKFGTKLDIIFEKSKS